MKIYQGEKKKKKEEKEKNTMRASVALSSLALVCLGCFLALVMMPIVVQGQAASMESIATRLKRYIASTSYYHDGTCHIHLSIYMVFMLVERSLCKTFFFVHSMMFQSTDPKSDYSI